MLRWVLLYAFFIGIGSLVPTPGAAAPTHPFLKDFYRVERKAVSTTSLFFRSLNLDDPPAQTISHRGQWLILNIWATWCAPCLAELPGLDQLAARNPSLAIWAVSVDETLSLGQMTATQKRLNLASLPLLHDANKTLPGLVNTRALPATLIIDPTGQARLALYGGTDWSSPAAQDFIQNLTTIISPLE
jgi:thiol-disulfide isomerase/thioredoxin